MRILVLDDQQIRHEQIRARLMGHDVTHAYLWSDFARALEGDRFDVIMLDHDLGDMIEQERKPGMYGDGTVYDGQDAARAVAELPAERMPGFVLVHSWNVEGARRMAGILDYRARYRLEMFDSAAFWSTLDAWAREGVKVGGTRLEAEALVCPTCGQPAREHYAVTVPVGTPDPGLYRCALGHIAVPVDGRRLVGR